MSQAKHGVAQLFGRPLRPADTADSQQLDREVRAAHVHDGSTASLPFLRQKSAAIPQTPKLRLKQILWRSKTNLGSPEVLDSSDMQMPSHEKYCQNANLGREATGELKIKQTPSSI